MVKVWLYVLRKREEEFELLVFGQLGAEAGTQIPAGTVEPGEALVTAARRELLEESGVAINSFTPLGTLERNWDGQAVTAHLFASVSPLDMPKEWVHRVTGKGIDEGMLFNYYWLPRAEWNKVWGGFKLGFSALSQFIANTIGTSV